MGCGSSKTVALTNSDHVTYTASYSESRTTRDADQLLTPEEIVLVRVTWEQLKTNLTLANLGKKVFLRIFNLKPDIKKLFPFSDVWGDDLIRHPKFVLHSERFMLVVDCCVQNLECIKSEHGEMLANLGRAHVNYKGFSRENFEVFMKAIWYVWYHQLKDSMDSEVECAWKKLLLFIIVQQRAGYDAEKEAPPNGLS
ncbi:hypothetical protein CAPTEDRAFT_190593 [Capitella teleta]|uniref:Globin domain-containing protein n=1 Tax=Capitella teleta TaxID=283909 RepID=R7UHS6_CAPTE|nr:hypothetical protein CAPTEDRAFT_190593 [Capitella teleta]|eukprot:ELU03358.1 hypothetical protein CAPTEDRAFT_190593 [Capitella teleta]